MGLLDNLGFIAQAAQRTGSQLSIRDLMAMKEQRAAEEERRYQRGRQTKEDRLMDTPVTEPGISIPAQPTTGHDIAGIINRGRTSVGLPHVPGIEAIANRQQADGGLGTTPEQVIRPPTTMSLREAVARKSLAPNMESIKARAAEAYMAGKIPESARAAIERFIGVKSDVDDYGTVTAGGTLFNKRTGVLGATAPGKAGDAGGSLERARTAFVAGKATPEELALINQDEQQYTKDYLQVYQGSAISPRQVEQVRRQAKVLYQVERMKQNPLPAEIQSASQAVKHLTTTYGFDDQTATEIVRQLLTLDAGTP